MAIDMAAFIARQIESMPAEATVIRKVVKALKDAGTPVVKVWDGEETVSVRTTQDVLNEVFNLDQSWLMTANGSWVLIILGNEWDALSDYTTDLEDALAPVNAYIETKW